MHEPSEIDAALRKLHVNNEDEKEIKECFKILKENATKNIRHMQPYKTNLKLLKDLSETAEEVKDGSLSERYVKQLKQSLNDYKNQVKFSDKPIRIALIGEIGVGKSTFGNVLLEGKGKLIRFETSAASESCTQVLRESTGNWFGDTSLEEITVIDTPGLSDPKDVNYITFKATLEGFKATSYLTTFVLVVNGSSPRLDKGHEIMVDVFSDVFGKNFLANMIIVGSRWPFDPISKYTREANGESEETKASEIANYFRKTFQIDRDVPSFFLDSTHYQNSFPGWEETEHRLQKFQQIVSKMLPYLTVDIKKEIKKKDEQMEILIKTKEALEKLGKDSAKLDEIMKENQRDREMMMKEFQDERSRWEQRFTHLQNQVNNKDKDIARLQKELDNKCAIL